MRKWRLAAVLTLSVACLVWAPPMNARADDTDFALRNGTVRIPSDTAGVVWAFGDTPCGYGLIVNLPGGTVVCFDENTTTVQVSQASSADDQLVHAVLASAPAYKRVPTETASATPVRPTPVAPRTGSNQAESASHSAVGPAILHTSSR